MSEKVHRAGEIQIHTVDREMIAALSARLTRRMILDLVIADRQLYISIGGETITGNVVRRSVSEG